MEETQLHDCEIGEMPYFNDQIMDFAKWYVKFKKPEIEIREANRHSMASVEWSLLRINELNRQIDENHKRLSDENNRND